VGPRQTGRYGMVIPNFVRQAISGHPITVYGDGEQRRCFTDVSDVVWALLRLAQSEEAVGQVINIGNDAREVSILDLAKLIKEKTKSDSEIVLVPYSQAYEEGFEDMPRRIPDLTKIKKLIGYEPKVGLDGILDRVIEHFMTNQGRA
jgi:UDP-glucose 4-epimerase